MHRSITTPTTENRLKNLHSKRSFAEALNETGHSGEARSYLNMIRDGTRKIPGDIFEAIRHVIVETLGCFISLMGLVTLSSQARFFAKRITIWPGGYGMILTVLKSLPDG